MSALDRVHRLNVGVAKVLTYGDAILHQSLAIIAGVAIVWLGWWAPGHYGWHFRGWWQAVPYGVMGLGAFGVWEGVARIIAMIKPAPPAPPPTKPEAW